MPPITRSLGQIHFEDLEPHRFEDLVRALLYDFRDWQKLEATGRGGGDDGFDARGWERIVVDEPADAADNEEAESREPQLQGRRLWLVQCKREKAIGPTALMKRLDEISADERHQLYGLIFAAACDFSKKAHDAFNERCREYGLSECYLWGRGELEDLLLQPKNDHLLFAHFGISLAVRRRSLRTELRARLATKRKAIKLFGKGEHGHHREALFRDPEDERYPYMKDENGSSFKEPLKWLVRRVVEVNHAGLVILFRNRMAYIADDGKSWDALSIPDEALPPPHDNPWEYGDKRDEPWEQTRRARIFWGKIPDANRARLKVLGFVPYDDILAIDDDGDGYTHSDIPHVFVKFREDDTPFAYGWSYLEIRGEQKPIDRKGRIKYFPDELPEADEPAGPIMV